MYIDYAKKIGVDVDKLPANMMEYGNTSAMVRLYFIDAKTGDRFPVSAGIGMFGHL